MHNLIWDFCSSDQRFAHELVCSSHPASFRFHLTMDTLAFGYILPTTGRIRDFNPLETCAARRTYTRIPAMPNNFALREFYYNLLLNSTAPVPWSMTVLLMRKRPMRNAFRLSSFLFLPFSLTALRCHQDLMKKMYRTEWPFYRWNHLPLQSRQQAMPQSPTKSGIKM